MKTNSLAAGDFPEIQAFAAKLNEVKFSEFASFSQKQIEELDLVLTVEIPKLMAVRMDWVKSVHVRAICVCCLHYWVCRLVFVRCYRVKRTRRNRSAPK
jgi:Domain of unknown function (DUF5600)